MSGLQLHETLSHYHWNVETQRQFKEFLKTHFTTGIWSSPPTLPVVPLDIIFIVLAALGISEGSLVI